MSAQVFLVVLLLLVAKLLRTNCRFASYGVRLFSLETAPLTSSPRSTTFRVDGFFTGAACASLALDELMKRQ